MSMIPGTIETDLMFMTEQQLLELWWNEDPELRYVEIMCGENLRFHVRLYQIDYRDREVARAEAGTLLQAIRGAVAMAREIKP